MLDLEDLPALLCKAYKNGLICTLRKRMLLNMHKKMML